MNKKTIAMVLLAMAGIGALVYFFVIRKKDALETATGDSNDLRGSALAAIDDVYYKKLKSRMEQNTNVKSNMGWVLDETKVIYDNNGSGSSWVLHKDYYAGGKVTKTGALMAVYAASVSGWSGGTGIEDSVLTNDLYSIFTEFKTKAAESAL